jgi:tetratricopeptide (TPR) repeat protein
MSTIDPLGQKELSEVGPQPSSLKVSLIHDHLAFANYPVLLGRHEDDGIWDAEKALDQRLNGKLSRRRSLGVYPGPVGTSLVMVERSDSALHSGHKGAIVVGMGPVGELLPNRLEHTVIQGAVKYALELAESLEGVAPAGAVIEAPISSLIVGSNFSGLRAEDSMQAILRGVLRANAHLAETDLSRTVRINRLQFVELYRDRAIRAAQSLHDLSQSSGLANRLEVSTELREGRGGRTRIPPDEDLGWWHRIQIARRSQTDPTLSFTTLTGRARAEVNLLPVQQSDVRRFVQRAVGSTLWNDRVASTLFHLLLPNEVKQLTSDGRKLVLLVDRDAAAMPWELLHDRTTESSPPFVTRSGLIRQLATQRYRPAPQEVRSGGALVVGDPLSDMPELPGAQAEAQEVASRITAAGLRVNRLMRPTSEQVLKALFASDYQIVHLAGHGVVNHEVLTSDGNGKQVVTGMVLGQGSFLTPGIVQQMPRIPEFVFINCCHLGDQRPDTKPRSDFHLLAANLSTQFVEMGVRAVIAAGWAVDDDAATTFAHTLYEQFFAGQCFGDAVQAAREAAYDGHPLVNTWGAYQCYGDPAYRLARRGKSASDRGQSIVSAEHAVHRFEEIQQRAVVGEDKNVLKSDLRATIQQLEAHWLRQSGELNQVIADAYAEIGEFEEAIRFYDRALSGEQASASLRTIEQRANLRVRWAKESGGDPAGMIQQSIDDLEALLRFGATAERLNLLGSAYKWFESVVTGKTKKANALKGAAKAYRRAAEVMRNRGDSNFAYPLTNWLALEFGTKPVSQLDWTDHLKTLAEAEEQATAKARKNPDFWSLVMPIDCRVIRHVYQDTLSESARSKLVADYVEAARQAGSIRELRSTVGQIDTLIDYLSRPRATSVEKKAQASRIESLSAVRSALEKKIVERG